MQYHEHPINPPLSEYIQSIWAMESENDEDHYPKSRIMPDGIVEIIFHYQTPFYTYQDDIRFLQPQNFAISMMRKYIDMESSGKAGFISVRFFPWGAYHFFNEPVSNFLDQTISADKLWGDQSQINIDKLKALTTIQERFKAVELFLLERLAENQKTDVQIDNAIKLVRESKGSLSIEAICKKTGYSKKQLERKFFATVGTTPKVFARISRFLSICNELNDHKHKTLTELTHECGYYDQAHFIKEFKEFSGFTPKEFFTKENVYFSEL